MLFGKEIITSRQNPTVRELAALLDKKERRKSRLFRIDGHKLFREAVNCGAKIDLVAICSDKAERYLPEVQSAGIKAVLLSPDVFSKITDEKAPDGIIAVVKYLDKIHKTLELSEISALASSDKRIMAFESLRDPGNLGTVIRSASAFGVDTLLLSSDCADIYNPKTLRGAMGAIFSREIIFCEDLPEALSRFSCEGRRVLAAILDTEAVAVDKAAITGRDIILIGNEGHGLSRSAVEASDVSVILPINTGRGVESLNAATAASVFMWEQKRVFDSSKK
ncbi:MAG: RNA methyltransferase [Clostridia bacterium]|nr:RNA methyltransferase [Clostridia bacterium]